MNPGKEFRHHSTGLFSGHSALGSEHESVRKDWLCQGFHIFGQY